MQIKEQKINFTANLDKGRNTTMSFIIEEAKETDLDFSQGTAKVLWVKVHWIQSIVKFLSI